MAPKKKKKTNSTSSDLPSTFSSDSTALNKHMDIYVHWLWSFRHGLGKWQQVQMYVYPCGTDIVMACKYTCGEFLKSCHLAGYVSGHKINGNSAGGAPF